MPDSQPTQQERDFLAPDPALAPQTTHHGFTVTSVEPIREISGCAYVMRHDATGARLMWLATPDVNKSFSIAFKTPPADDTGVFHILEHSVLDGSDRFPVKEPFVNLLKTSMQTFLNALTFQDKTMYPVSSTNEKDLENLMDVYLDAVLHPAIYRRPRIFEQEGWHYELADDGTLTYNGVVFNEMKGALSDPDEVLFHEVQAQLFPDTPYRFESGGDPRQIPTLTYQSFLDHHARHYQLSNSYTILYGDIDPERELAFLDERFSEADDRGAGAPNPLPMQRPVVQAAPAQVRMATAPENSAAGIGYVIGTAADRERVLACDVLLDTLAGSNEAPLKRAVMDAGLADDFTATLLDGTLQPVAFLQLKGLREGAAQRFRPLVESVCCDLVRDGIDHQKLAASLAQAEFNLREGDWGGYTDGVALSIQAMSSWLYDDARPCDYLRYEDALAHMRDGLEDGYFERLLDEVVCHSAHTAEVELVPTDEAGDAEEAAELAARKAAMSDDELAQVSAEVAALREEQGRPDSPEDLAKLPTLGREDIGEAPAEPPMTTPEAPLPCLAHELDTHRIDYVYYYFDLKRIAYEELPYVSVLCELLGRLDTRHHRATDLDTLVETKLGNLSFFCETYSPDEDPSQVDPKLVVGASALSENVEALADIPREVWGETLFGADTDRVRELLQQRRIDLEQGFVGSGNSAALSRTNAQLTPAGRVAEQMGGVDFYLFLRKLLARWDRRRDATVEVLYNLASRIFTSDDVVVSFTGPAEDRRRFWDAAGDLGLRQKGRLADDMLVVPDAAPTDEAFVIPANVCFVAQAGPQAPCDHASFGTWQVGIRPLSLGYLWNEVRVKGGAYGAGIRHLSNGITQNQSFRDPGIDPTIERYGRQGAWLAQWQPEEGELDGYVVSTVASLDAPRKPRALARMQDVQRFCGKPADWRQQVRAQMLATTADDVRALAPSLDYVAQHHVTCVFGPAQKIAASSHDFRVTELMPKDEA